MSVVAKATCRIAGKRSNTLIVKGRVYDDAAPVVKARPDLFEPAEQHQERVQPARGTPDLGKRSMSARKQRSQPAVETARKAPGEMRDMGQKCPEDGCEFVATSDRSMKIHRTKAHG